MAISIFMELESSTDGVIEGGCDIKGREGWVECLEMAHKVYLPTDTTTGSVMGKRVHEPFQITKASDVSSPPLYKHLCTGTDLATVKFHFYHITSAGKEAEYYTIVLTNAKVISMEPALYNTREPRWEKMPHLEVVKFAYEQITWTENKDHKEHMDNYRNENV